MLRSPGSLDRSVGRSLLVGIILLGTITGASAADLAVVSSGSWTATSTWTGGVVPGVSDNAFVGSATPSGALGIATVTLTQDASAGDVYLGHNTGTAGTLALGTFTFTADSLYFGFVGTGAVTRDALAPGHLDVNTFDIRNGNSFTLLPIDRVRQSLSAQSGSTATLADNLSVSDVLDVRDTGTTLNAQNHNITANQILLGWNGSGNPTLLNRGNLTAASLNVRNQAFQLIPTDTIGTFTLVNGTTSLTSGVSLTGLFLKTSAVGTTATDTNVNARVGVESGSTLTLGTNLRLSDYLDIRDTGTVVNAGNFNITATNQILLGWNGSGNPTLQNRGAITTNALNVRNQSFQLTGADSVGTFTLANGTTNLAGAASVNGLFLKTAAVGTLAASGNVRQRIGVESGSSFTANAPLALTDYLDVREAGTVVNLQGNSVTATNQILIGWNGSGTPSVVNGGRVTTGHWLESNAVQATLTSGGDSIGQISLRGNSRLTVAPNTGLSSGLTVTNASSSAMDITAGNKLTLGSAGAAGGWVLRWANPNAGDHIADLTSLIGSGTIDFTNGGVYTLGSPGDGYTYVFTPVPEPATAVGVSGLALAGVAGLRRWRRRPAAWVRLRLLAFLANRDREGAGVGHTRSLAVAVRPKRKAHPAAFSA